MEREQVVKSALIEMLIANIKIVRDDIDVVGNDWEFAKYKAMMDELVYKLHKKQEEWSKEK